MSQKQICTKYFLKYLIEEASFYPDNYKGIMELNGEAENSICYLLKDYNTYLISKTINKFDLAENNLKGCFGTIDIDENNNPYINPKLDSFNYDSFDAIVSNQFSTNLLNACHFDKDIYFGFCRNMYNIEYSKIEKKLNQYKQIRDYLNKLGKNYELISDIDSINNKIFCIVKKRK